MTKHFKFEKTEMRKYLGGMAHRRICSDCINHEQGDTMVVEDCKNTYGDYHEYGQCGCYSKEHGVRE